MNASQSHVEAALDCLAGAGDGRNFATDATAAAQVHATLALAEQVARIADFLDAIPVANNDAPIVVTHYGGEA